MGAGCCGGGDVRRDAVGCYFRPQRPYGPDSPVERLARVDDPAVDAAGRAALVRFARLHTRLRVTGTGAAEWAPVSWTVTDQGRFHSFAANLACASAVKGVDLSVPDPFPRSTVRELAWQRRGNTLRVAWHLRVEPGEVMRPLPHVVA